MRIHQVRRSALTFLLVAAIGGGTQVAVAASTGDPAAGPTSADRGAAPDSSARRHVSFHGVFDPAGFLTPSCDSSGRCVYALGRTGTRLTGAFEGTTVSGGAGTPTGSGFVGTGVHVFTGTVEGCGHGSVVFTETIESVDAVTSTGTWQLVDGSGTGGLDVQGNGTFTAVQRPDGSGITNSVGRIRC